jgi:putative zinc finger protein
MRCGKARTMINLELDGVLPPEQTPHLDEHLATCSDCRAYRADLETGSRMIRATAAEPSDAFEWKLQLKLNQALQEAAGAGTPWQATERSPWFGWLRSFGLSSAAGLALVLVVTTWVLPDGLDRATDRSGPVAGRVLDSPAQTERTADRSDRLSLQPASPVFSFGGNGSAGRVVSGGTFLSGSDSWLKSGPDERRSFSVLQAEVQHLRDQLSQSRLENERLMALLDGSGVKYLEEEDALHHE